ncbi:hypothetical protein I4F81_005622 [Pyropia yezoensis]|uniref:Uncharacterized protein n=1 Tax=Pyropia yezoensis TaxID=2788 RepID=A0ACC3BZT1_PYRYE|nr:hypothetical protein I4F81_005622 [Neopyropia yezoensis]
MPRGGGTRSALFCVMVAAAALALLTASGVVGQLEQDPTCKNQTDDGIDEDTLGLFGGEYLHLRKRPTLLKDGVLTVCPATASVAAGAWTYHGTVNPETGEEGAPDSRRVYWTFPPTAMSLNGIVCNTAGGGNVTVDSYYDTQGQPRLGVEGFGAGPSLSCGIFQDLDLQWFADPRRRIARLFISRTPASADDWSCGPNAGSFECVLWRPLCKGGSLDFKGIPFAN